MKRIVVIAVLAVVFAFALIQDRDQHISSNAQIARAFLTGKGYKIISCEGSPQTYVLTKEKLVQMPYEIYWALQSVDPSRYIGKSIDVEKFIVKNHPLDYWGAGGTKSKGKTEVYVYVAENQAVGGTSFPVLDSALGGGYWSLDGKTLEEVQHMDFQTWGKEWRKKYSQ